MTEVNNVKVIGIDHGFGNVKTASCCFRSGVTLCEKEPTFKANMLVYDGRYYLKDARSLRRTKSGTTTTTS